MVLPCMAIPFFQNADTADLPVLFDAEEGLNGDFPADFEEWLCDSFGFHDAAIRANALMNYRLFHTSANDEVIAGRGDWLYYAETAGDFTGEGRLTQDELAALADNLRAMAGALEARGTRLYVAIVPNKNTVYPQYMPARYAMRRDDGNIALLRDACAGMPLTWIDLLTPLRAAADEGVYYHTDTHWNALGARIAADEILRAMGRAVSVHSADAETAAFSGGDLARIMGLDGAFTETAPVIADADALPEADYAEFELDVSGAGEGSLLMLRDSFGTAVAPWIVNAYEEASLLWQSPLEISVQTDDCLLLIAERNLRRYLGEPPILEEAFDDEDSGDDEALMDEAPDDEAFMDEEPDDDEAFMDDEPVDDEAFDGEDSGDDEFAREEDGDGI